MGVQEQVPTSSSMSEKPEKKKLWSKREFLVYLQEQLEDPKQRNRRAMLARDLIALRGWNKKGARGRPRKVVEKGIPDNIHELVLREATNGKEI